MRHRVEAGDAFYWYTAQRILNTEYQPCKPAPKFKVGSISPQQAKDLLYEKYYSDLANRVNDKMPLEAAQRKAIDLVFEPLEQIGRRAESIDDVLEVSDIEIISQSFIALFQNQSLVDAFCQLFSDEDQELVIKILKFLRRSRELLGLNVEKIDISTFLSDIKKSYCYIIEITRHFEELRNSKKYQETK